MTFLESAKYVAYGFFGMVLFGTTVNKVFASDVSLSCVAKDDDTMLACGKPGGKEDEIHWCLPVQKHPEGMLKWVCTQDKELFDQAHTVLSEAGKTTERYQGIPNAGKTPQGRLHRF